MKLTQKANINHFNIFLFSFAIPELLYFLAFGIFFIKFQALVLKLISNSF